MKIKKIKETIVKDKEPSYSYDCIFDYDMFEEYELRSLHFSDNKKLKINDIVTFNKQYFIYKKKGVDSKFANIDNSYNYRETQLNFFPDTYDVSFIIKNIKVIQETLAWNTDDGKEHIQERNYIIIEVELVK